MNENSEAAPDEAVKIREEKRTRSRAYWAGVVVSNIVGLLTLIAINVLVSQTGNSLFSNNAGVTFIASQIVAIPIGMGIVASFFWRKLDLKTEALSVATIWVTVLALIGATVILHEGAICLLMACPLLYFLVWVGGMLGDSLWKHNPWLGASALPVFVVLLIFDARVPHHHAAIVRDEILIQAPPARVWKYIAAYPPITAPPNFWLWKIGLPYPTQSTADGAFVGARRDCRFSGNVVFEEKIVQAKAPQLLTFDVTKQPDHPEITGHFNLDRGRFELRDNGDGTTTLIGTTWYRLHIYPTQYFDLWAAAIIRRVHFRVFEQVKILAERNA
jgi:uncharacterized protein YndB with AHSA1/START domain